MEPDLVHESELGGSINTFSSYEADLNPPYHINAPRTVLSRLMKLQKYTQAKGKTYHIGNINELLAQMNPVSEFLQPEQFEDPSSYRPNELILVVHYALAGIGKSHLTKIFEQIAKFYSVNFSSISTDEISEKLIKDLMQEFSNMS